MRLLCLGLILNSMIPVWAGDFEEIDTAPFVEKIADIVHDQTYFATFFQNRHEKDNKLQENTLRNLYVSWSEKKVLPEVNHQARNGYFEAERVFEQIVKIYGARSGLLEDERFLPTFDIFRPSVKGANEILKLTIASLVVARRLSEKEKIEWERLVQVKEEKTAWEQKGFFERLKTTIDNYVNRDYVAYYSDVAKKYYEQGLLNWDMSELREELIDLEKKMLWVMVADYAFQYRTTVEIVKSKKVEAEGQR